ncbi:hypothetical protein GCM10010341_68870 [Streptomyces noursei]|nr:hypothetical protein GCM10010341_68870 [Streptomyces noursei]
MGEHRGHSGALARRARRPGRGFRPPGRGCADADHGQAVVGNDREEQPYDLAVATGRELAPPRNVFLPFVVGAVVVAVAAVGLIAFG